MRGGGLAVGLDHLSFEEAIREADVSRTAAYRCWPHKDAFLADLSVELARQAVPVAPTRNEHSTRLVRDLVHAHAGRLRTRAQRARTLEEVVRVTAADDFDLDRVEARRWQTYLALILALRTMPPGPLRDQVADALAEADDLLTDRVAGSYRMLIEFFGFRSVVDYPTLARIGLALMRGLVVGELAGRPTDAGPDVAAIAFAGLLVANIEPADESTWSRSTIEAKLAALAVEDIFA